MLDIKEVISSTRAYNLHSHTQFCDGHAPMADFAAQAAAMGMKHYGFTPHSPIPFDSPCNMRADNVDAYLAEFRRLRDLHAPALRLYAGMEIDYLGPEWGPAHPYFATLGLDYAIGSVHFLPAADGYVDIDGRFERFKRNMAEHFADDIRHVVTLFYRRSMDMVEAGGFDIVGHFDKIGHNASHFRPGIEDEPWYRHLADDLADCIIARGVTVELNTKAYADHSQRTFPSRRLLRRILAAGIPVVVNSDAHRPALIDASRAEGFAMIDSIIANPHEDD
ncbi:MAG: histidinol-phosphatase [Candidatus Amulumruptor caecigallinarius]|nr:histidinol-phosphatase [Candidatus Amulumruptor caecigallinarius]MCM1396062.1 histidinol-phosphatase [Candidatus Amulumruptor caecigallinarius]MCM1453061.1 histidinol-phosphatase [bacterium]